MLLTSEQLKMIEEVKKDPKRFNRYKPEEQFEELCLEAVRGNAHNLKYVRKQTSKICLEAVENNGYVIEYIKNHSHEMAMVAIENCPEAINYIKL